MIAEVVTYDPIRRKGFMRLVEQPNKGRVHFNLSMLPTDFKQPVIEISRCPTSASLSHIVLIE